MFCGSRGAAAYNRPAAATLQNALRRYQNLGVVGVAPRQQPARERRQHLLGGAVQVERRERVGARRAVVEERDEARRARRRRARGGTRCTPGPSCRRRASRRRAPPPRANKQLTSSVLAAVLVRGACQYREAAARINCARVAGRQGCARIPRLASCELAAFHLPIFLLIVVHEEYGSTCDDRHEAERDRAAVHARRRRSSSAASARLKSSRHLALRSSGRNRARPVKCLPRCGLLARCEMNPLALGVVLVAAAAVGVPLLACIIAYMCRRRARVNYDPLCTRALRRLGTGQLRQRRPRVCTRRRRRHLHRRPARLLAAAERRHGAHRRLTSATWVNEMNAELAEFDALTSNGASPGATRRRCSANWPRR